MSSAAAALPLQPVQVGQNDFRRYCDLLTPALVDEIERRASELRGLRVVQVNATPAGGGVAEILQSLVPLLRSLGIDAHWYVLPPDPEFFAVTKKMHNLLQGYRGRLSAAQKDTYWGYQARVANGIRQAGLQADVWVIHDPQPLPLRVLTPLEGRTLWRCHIDSSTPQQALAHALLPYVRAYDRSIFSMPEYLFPGLPEGHAEIVYPAIDPLIEKNVALPRQEALSILSGLGIDTTRPLVTQVSRFDPWKNPIQVVDAYRLAKRELPGLQLAMLGVFSAKDDPEGPQIYRAVRRHAGDDPDVHLFTDPEVIRQREVNAFQAASHVVLQRSIREGFGLTVTEAMWKGTPVIANAVGGITVQVTDGVDGFLVEGAAECAALIVRLIREPALAEQIGAAARQTVREKFLLPRLLRDDLRLYAA